MKTFSVLAGGHKIEIKAERAVETGPDEFLHGSLKFLVGEEVVGFFPVGCYSGYWVD